jgi:SAM-dependent methyltransferase
MQPKQHEKTTSWGGVADWYAKLLSGEGTYQSTLILPNTLRLLGLKPGMQLLDIACGPGYFAGHFMKTGARVTGVDISRELIRIAEAAHPNATFHVAPADSLPFLEAAEFDRITVILAIQNIEDVAGVFTECARVLKPEGKLLVVMNHPAFRIPRASSWGWDEASKTQYRRLDSYLSEARIKIEMHPGSDPLNRTITFHRPLQFYVKALGKAGLTITRLEEWNSNRKSEAGPRAEAENRARKEIPLFLCLEATKG